MFLGKSTARMVLQIFLEGDGLPFRPKCFSCFNFPRYKHRNASSVSISHGINFDVCLHCPALCFLRRSSSFLAMQIYKWQQDMFRMFLHKRTELLKIVESMWFMKNPEIVH